MSKNPNWKRLPRSAGLALTIGHEAMMRDDPTGWGSPRYECPGSRLRVRGEAAICVCDVEFTVDEYQRIPPHQARPWSETVTLPPSPRSASRHTKRVHGPRPSPNITTVAALLAELRSIHARTRIEGHDADQICATFHDAPEEIVSAAESAQGIKRYIHGGDGVEYDVVSGDDDVGISVFGERRKVPDQCWLCKESGADTRDGIRDKPVHRACVERLAKTAEKVHR